MRTPTKKTLAFSWITRQLLEQGSVSVEEVKDRFDIADRTWREWRLTMERFLELDVTEKRGRLWLNRKRVYTWKPGEEFDPDRMSREHLIQYCEAMRNNQDTGLKGVLSSTLKTVTNFVRKG